MKIRFWTKKNNSILLLLLALPIITIVGNYMHGKNTDYIVFLPGYLICAAFFLPNYFRFTLVLSENSLLIREGVFKRAVSIDIDNIKYMSLSELNREPVSIVFELYEGNKVTWNTRERSQELYDKLVNANLELCRHE